MLSQELKSSSKRIGQLYPILIDYYGNVIDGEHRFGVDETWKRMKLEHIKTEKDRLIARIASNIVRRSVSSKEKKDLLDKLGEIYLNDGIAPGKIAYTISEETGMSYTWVMKYLPYRFKDSLKSESARATWRVAEKGMLIEPPKEKILTIQNYRNTNFINVILEKNFYSRLERLAGRLGTTPDIIISNALIITLRKLEREIKSSDIVS